MFKQFPATRKLWLGRIILQTGWRRRRVSGPNEIINVFDTELVSEASMADGNRIPTILKTNFVLIMAISLGLSVDIHDLFAPDDKCVFYPCSL